MRETEVKAPWHAATPGHPGFANRDRANLTMAVFVAEGALAIGIARLFSIWSLQPNGFSPVSQRLPYWDFTNLWAGSLFARLGHVDWLFDVDAYRAGLRALFSPDLPNHEWSYPPSILLFGAPLSWLPIFVAYLVFTFATLLILHFALRPFRFHPLAHMAVLFGPASMVSIGFGQNGNLTASLLVGALVLSDKRPWLAGVLSGLLTIKPQIGVLIPFAFLAAGNWRAIVSAAVTTCLLAAATGLAFGFSVWPDFLTKTTVLMSGIMNAPFPQHYQVNAVNFFVFGRFLGLAVNAAHAFQLIFTLAAVSMTMVLWWKPGRLDIFGRALLTALLGIIATPYGYSYDMVPYGIAVAWWFLRSTNPNRLFFAGLWLFPAFAQIPAYFGVNVSIIVPAIFIIWVLREEGILFGARQDVAAG